MHKFRSTWLALIGGAFLVTLSISAAFGADPADETDGNRGQTIAAFVHTLVFGEDEPIDDEVVEEDQDENTEEADEADGALLEGESHGDCVSRAAHDKTTWVEDGLSNHGEWVSLHARELCRELAPTDEAADEAATDDEATDEDADADELTAKEERKAEKADAKVEKAAAKEERTAGKP